MEVLGRERIDILAKVLGIAPCLQFAHMPTQEGRAFETKTNGHKGLKKAGRSTALMWRGLWRSPLDKRTVQRFEAEQSARTAVFQPVTPGTDASAARWMGGSFHRLSALRKSFRPLLACQLGEAKN